MARAYRLPGPLLQPRISTSSPTRHSCTTIGRGPNRHRPQPVQPRTNRANRRRDVRPPDPASREPEPIQGTAHRRMIRTCRARVADRARGPLRDRDSLFPTPMPLTPAYTSSSRPLADDRAVNKRRQASESEAEPLPVSTYDRHSFRMLGTFQA